MNSERQPAWRNSTLPTATPAWSAVPLPGLDPSAGGAVAWAIRRLVNQIAGLSLAAAAIDVGLTLGVALAAAGLIWILDRLLRRGVERLAQKGLVEDAAARSGPKAAAASRRLLKIGVIGVAALLILQIWGVAPLAWLSGAGGAAALRLGVLVVLGAGAVEISGRVIERSFRDLAMRSRDLRRAAQFHTLRPIVKGLTNGCLVLFFGLTLLSELGVKIAPLLAGAGVVGVALGFGAQTLVKDFITGLFLIIEDIVSVGDNVMIGGFSGLVESMTLRTIRLRDFDGALHVFPYSEAQVIHNRTKSFSYAVFEPKISYLADIEQATRVMRKVGAGVKADPQFARMILEPLEVVGVDQFTDVGVVVKARIKTKPGDQWRVGREFNRRLKLAFDAARVEIGYPTVQADRTLADERSHDGAVKTTAAH